MPVRWMHERCQTSRGGLAGSDASWRPLVTVREEARRRCGIGGKAYGGHHLRCRHRRKFAQQRCDGAEGHAKTALVGGAAVVMIVVFEAGMVVAGVVVMLGNRVIVVLLL